MLHRHKQNSVTMHLLLGFFYLKIFIVDSIFLLIIILYIQFEDVFSKYIIYCKIILYCLRQGLTQSCIIRYISSINPQINVQIIMLSCVKIMWSTDSYWFNRILLSWCTPQLSDLLSLFRVLWNLELCTLDLQHCMEMVYYLANAFSFPTDYFSLL